jgi:hypothetical protein
MSSFRHRGRHAGAPGVRRACLARDPRNTTGLRTGAGHGWLPVDETIGTIYALLRGSRLSGRASTSSTGSRSASRGRCSARTAANASLARPGVAMASFMDKDDVDINQGFGEVMAEFDLSAVPGAVANR